VLVHWVGVTTSGSIGFVLLAVVTLHEQMALVIERSIPAYASFVFIEQGSAPVILMETW